MAYDESWNRPHPPGSADNWQESDCYWFFDSEARVGGYHRIGQYPNQKNGQILAFFFKEGGQYFRQFDTAIPGGQCSRSETGQIVGTHTVESLGDDCIRYTCGESDCEVDLQFCEQFYVPRNWMDVEDDHAAAIEEGFNSDGHLEVAGRVKGRVRIGVTDYEIDALAQRDRSWGNRVWGTARQGRQITGTLGKHLSWTAVLGQLEKDAFVFKVGFVARNGETTGIKDIKTLATIDYDGLSVARMQVRLILEDGSHVDLSGDALQGFLTVWPDGMDNTVVSQNLVEVEQDGVRGMSNFECTIQPRKGAYVPTEKDVSLTRIREGLHDAADYSTFRW